ncbi:MAG: putative drug exporter of the superfamily [Solirubrobacterales bacterium]|nr:putative drug exporter of the superfamily [Solirubrobacterales bacterium]
MLAVAAILLAALAVIGTGTQDRLDPTTLDIPGTEASRSNEILREHFGDSAPFAILLRGPAKAIDEQGPELIEKLREDPRVTTLSPWDIGSVQRLRPEPDKALILADFHVDGRTSVNETVPHLNEVLEEKITPPVRATQTGYASLSEAIQEENLDASRRGEMIALPFLLIILLLVFRSPIAAAIPLALGAITVVASRGILYFFTGWFDINSFALVVCSMMGLALGVDYALLMVSRFREELAEGAEPVEAARLTRRHAGRTVCFAGSTLLISMIVSLFILPGSLLASLAGTVCMVVILSVVEAILVGPAILTLLGPNVDRWRFGATAPAGGRSRLMTMVGAALKRPTVAAAVIGAVLLVLAAPTLGLKTGPPDTEQLDKDAPARKDAELVTSAIGQGYDAPFQVVAVSREGPITDPKSIGALQNFQRKVAERPGVRAVIGPGPVVKRVEPLQRLGNSFLSSEGDTGQVKQLARLGRELEVAAGGVGQLREGISEASDGAGLLALGSGRAAEGAQLIANGLGRATDGSQEAIDALDRFAKGARQLENGIDLAGVGAFRLKIGIRDTILPNLRFNALRLSRALQKSLNGDANTKLPELIAPARTTEDELKKGLAQLESMTVGKSDPNYAAALEAVRKATAAVSGKDPVTGAPYDPVPETPEVEPYTGLPAELVALNERLLENHKQAKETSLWIVTTQNAMKATLKGTEKLEEGLRELHAGSNRLAAGSARLAREAKRLGDGISQLGGGALQLVDGLDELGDGAEALRAGLATGVDESEPLESGLEEASVQVLNGRDRITDQVGRVSKSSPGLFNSGYFVLSALDGTPPTTRTQINETIDLDRGGQAATMLIIPDYTFNSPGSIRLNKELNREAGDLAADSGLETGVAGGAAELNEYSRVTRERMPWVIIAITIVTFLVLMVVLRALLLAAIAVALNLVTVAVAFGVLVVLFHIPDSWPLGGHNYVDAVGATLIFGLVFGLSIDYAVFLLSRMREHYDTHGDNAAAVDFGLSRTAGVITGAALIMMVVFIAFAGAPIATVSQLGVGLTVAVILDATVVRIVLLPALMLLLGDRVWWLPKPLERVIPKLSV